MYNQVQTKLSEQRERLEKLKVDWSKFVGNCIREVTRQRESHAAILAMRIPTEDDLLNEFWSQLSILSSPEEKLKALQEMATVKLEDLNDKQLKRRRHRFNKKKRGRLKLRDVECFVCGNPRHLDRHHIIQIKYGGSNQALNLVALCIPCHESIHPWMAK